MMCAAESEIDETAFPPKNKGKRPRRDREKEDSRLLKKRAYRGMTLEEAKEAEERHRRTLQVLAVLLVVQFFASVSLTITGTAMPVIVAEIGGDQAEYAWILTAGVLANTIVTPLIGKLADLMNKKVLFVGGIITFMVGSFLCGLAQSPKQLIAFRVFQGLAMGTQITLTQVVLASILPPRERGRYNGYMGATLAVATVSGPLIGGIIVDTMGWRWCYWVVIPFMLISLVVAISRLQVPPPPLDENGNRRKVRIDFIGIGLIGTTATLLLLWVSAIGKTIALESWTSAGIAAILIALVVIFVFTEYHVKEPIFPPVVLGNRTAALAIVAMLAIGTAMMSTTVYLGQYFQYGLGFTPTLSGLLGLPTTLGLVLASTITGNLVSRHGNWKVFVVFGLALLMSAFSVFYFVADSHTPIIVIEILLLAGGIGLGSSNMNLVLAVQNSVGIQNMGAATSSVTFFRTLFGAVGIQVMGLIYSLVSQSQVAMHLPASKAAQFSGSFASLDLKSLPDDVEKVVRAAFADSLGSAYLLTAFLSLVALVAVLLIPGQRLRTTVDIDRIRAESKRQEAQTIQGQIIGRA